MRCLRSGSEERCAGRTLIATSRSSRVSRARYTSPIPPAPSKDWISYGPSFVPGVSVIGARHYNVPSQGYGARGDCGRMTVPVPPGEQPAALGEMRERLFCFGCAGELPPSDLLDFLLSQNLPELVTGEKIVVALPPGRTP